MQIKGKALKLLTSNIDTDQIFPARHLTGISKTGLGIYLFEDVPNNPLDAIDHEDCKVVLTLDNFGCGSSREHAVWALSEYGINCVIAKSFGDIFKANSIKNGLLPIEIIDEVYQKISSNDPNNANFQISLETQEVKMNDELTFKFEIDPFRKHCLLQGLDDLDYLLDLQADIEAFRKNNQENKFIDTNWVSTK